MYRELAQRLEQHEGVTEWTLRHVHTSEHQLYAIPDGIEAQRTVENERYEVDVLRDTHGQDGTHTCGTATTTLLPGDDIETALNEVCQMAGLVRNPSHGVPEPAEMPKVELADERLLQAPTAEVVSLYERLRDASAGQADIRLTAAEIFATTTNTRLTNSRGIAAEQTDTTLEMEWVLVSERDGRQAEFFNTLTRRRLDDLDLPDTIRREKRYVVDLLDAGPPQAYTGPVVLRGDTLATVVDCNTLKRLSSGAFKHKHITPWVIGDSVFPHGTQRRGDPLTVWANRRLPYGANSSQFDQEGIPGKRVLLIKDDILQTFVANQQYAEYLDILPTGDFGNVEVPAGTMPAAELVSPPYVEIIAFSWFNPDVVTGDFASEIRLGYVVEEGGRTPFKGGMLVGNVMGALANVHWSAETDFHGTYRGPTAARFGELTVSEGSRQG